ncbi:MAG: hypothetical protein JEZ07_17415 [Phycisphaerae bacterium]|nr:hypothetical protein [Phycisphaerae bacterium]
MKMLADGDVWIRSIRLDRYYSNPKDVNSYRGCDIYFIPKKNVTMGNGLFWNERLTEFVDDTFGYLKEYYKLNNSESGFGVDKSCLVGEFLKKEKIELIPFFFAKQF